jgi:hypothetical protein
MKARNWIASHVVVFAAGAYAGYAINADELSTYRGLHEHSFSRFKRRAGQLGLGVLVVSAIVMVARVASRTSNKAGAAA